jgi:hypothetical protein
MANIKTTYEDRFVPEKELCKSDWSTLLETEIKHTREFVAPLPDEQIWLLYDLFSETESQRLISVADKAGFGFTKYVLGL